MRFGLLDVRVSEHVCVVTGGAWGRRSGGAGVEVLHFDWSKGDASLLAVVFYHGKVWFDLLWLRTSIWKLIHRRK